MTLSARISAASVAMLDHLFYLFASPLAREIIDSLRDEPGEWIADGEGFMESPRFCIHENGFCYWANDDEVESDSLRSYLVLRRAVNKWRKRDG